MKDGSVDVYLALAWRSEEEELRALIAKGEGHTLEFKSSARWDMKENRANKEMEKVIVKAVAGFLNTDGGVLLIGVDDEGVAVGLQHDYQLVKNKNRDGYENWLMGLLLGYYGKELSGSIRITFAKLGGADVCCLAVTRAAKPVYVKEDPHEHLYVRTGNSTRSFTTKEAVEWVKRWEHSDGDEILQAELLSWVLRIRTERSANHIAGHLSGMREFFIKHPALLLVPANKLVFDKWLSHDYLIFDRLAASRGALPPSAWTKEELDEMAADLEKVRVA